jgi:hypothetical protein
VLKEVNSKCSAKISTQQQLSLATTILRNNFAAHQLHTKHSQKLYEQTTIRYSLSQIPTIKGLSIEFMHVANCHPGWGSLLFYWIEISRVWRRRAKIPLCGSSSQCACGIVKDQRPFNFLKRFWSMHHIPWQIVYFAHRRRNTPKASAPTIDIDPRFSSMLAPWPCCWWQQTTFRSHSKIAVLCNKKCFYTK